MTPQDSTEARIAETAKQLEWESTAANSAASFVERYADECCRHTEAVADCAHCNLRFLASYARRSGALMADAEYLLGRLHEQAQEIDALNARLNDVILAWNRETVRAEAAEAKAHEQAQEIERLREQERQLGQAQAYDFPED